MKQLVLWGSLLALCGVATGALVEARRGLGVRLPFNADHELKGHRQGQTPTILYHGGPVMLGTNNIYVIYYGSFSSIQTGIVDTFLHSLGGSGAFNVNTTYFDAQGRHISNLLAYTPSNSFDDNYSLGNSLKNSAIPQAIANAIAAHRFPADASGFYALITSPDVRVPAGSYCGYHTRSSTIAPGVDIKYAFIPDPGPSQFGCSGNVATFGDTTSPNGDIGMDSVADTLMHEVSETVTDPDLNAWFTKNGEEVGDLCNFVYGTTFITANGSHANHTFGGKNYLAQEIWENSGAGFCAAQF